MSPKKGNSFPIGRDMLTDVEFAQVIASALKVEFGSTPQAVFIWFYWHASPTLFSKP